jgi:RHS repeat-associated protein
MSWHRTLHQRGGGLAAALAVGVMVAAPTGAVPASASAVGVAAATAGKPIYNPPAYRGKLWKPRKLQATPSVGGHTLARDSGAVARARLRPPHEPGALRSVPYKPPARLWWPTGTGTARLAEPVAIAGTRLPGTRMRLVSGPQQAGTLPVTVAAMTSKGMTVPAPGQVTVAVQSRAATHAAGVSGVLMRVTGAPGSAVVRLDYTKFARNYGGSWASRLKFVEMPACSLTTPAAAGCRRQTPLTGGNNGTTSVWAQLSLGSVPAPEMPGAQPSLSALLPEADKNVVLASISTPGGSQGTYAATSLNPEGTWAVQQGNFSYDYPIAVPPSLGGQAPDVALSYSSETIDGESSAQNPQGTQIGDGWTYSPGSIEQSFESCSQDTAATQAEQGDECWDGWNATLSLSGHSSILIGSGPGTWHAQDDDGTKVQLVTTGSNGISGSYGDEYWVVTTTDGTRYYFGADHVPGDNSSSLTTSSAWNVPVYCPQSTDPCYSSSSGTSSWAQMPYQWNLDYVVDPDNNLTVYKYATESNYYERGGATGSGTLTSYIRDGYLTTVMYGWHLSDATASPAILAADKIVFGSSQRCLVTSTQPCTSLTSSDEAAWPDVPFDQICGSSGTCDNASPTYFSEYRLTSIDTYVLKSQSSGTYDEVDSYALTQSFPAGGSSSAVMALDSIALIGEDGTPVTPPLPPTAFSTDEFNNRVVGTTQPAEYRPRVVTINTEAGAEISVAYNTPACTQGTGGNITDSDAPANTLACYPSYWAPPGDGQTMDWFNQYTISQVTEADETGAGTPAQVTNYYYLGGAAWHQDESPTMPSAYRTWDEFRGFAKVETTTGVAPGPVTETMTWYMRGMYGDANGSGGTTTTQVSDSLGDTYNDYNYLSGQVLETDTYTQAVGSPDVETVNGPWTYNQTASMTPPSGSGLTSLTAEMLAQSQTRTRRLLASGSWQTSTSTSYYDGDARVVAVDSAPAGLTQTCTSTSYATTPSGNPMMEIYPDRSTTVTGAYSGGSCPAAAASDIVSDTETYYDDESATLTSLGTLGSLASPGGLATGQQTASGWPPGGSEAWQPESATAYDGYGRPVSQTHPSETSAAGAVTTTSYTPATGQLPTSTTTKNPLGWQTVTELDQARQLPTQVTDQNGEITTETYDALGRVTSVTLPIDQGGDASYKYSYDVTGSLPPAVTTQTLREDGSYASDVKIYDGLLQLVQEQTSTADAVAGRLVTDYGYDSHGWPVSSTAPFYDSTTNPGTSLYVPTQSQIPSQTIKTYDGQGRTTASQFWSLGVLQWQTTVSYPGTDQTDTTPPAGGTPTVVTTNSTGQTATSTTYVDTSSPTANSDQADTTSYSYTPAGQAASVADQNGNTSTYGYNLLGQKTSATDPGTTGTAGPSGKAGTTTYAYDGDGNMTSATEPDGTVLTWTYDVMDRKTAEYNATPGVAGEPVELASWAYDKTPINGGADALGQPTSSTSYDSSGQADTETITDYNIAYEPTGTSLSIPSDQGALASGSSATQYTTSTAYTPRTGLPEYTSYSADAGLPAEAVQNTYDEAGLLTEFGDSNAYLDGVSYSPLGQVLSTTFGASGSQLVQDYTYDAGTNRMLQSITNLQTLSSAADTTSYTYDQNGDITSTSDAENNGQTQTQCFSYTNSELTAAWTDTGGTSTTTTTAGGGQSVSGIGGCNHTTPQAANIGGAAPYWETYTYDLLGDRTSETTYNTSLPASQDTLANATVQQVAYPGGSIGTNSPASDAPATAQTQPDTATNIVTASPSGTTTTTPRYDADGQETQASSTHTGSAPPASPDAFSSITYNPQGQVASVTTAAGTSTYLYDANGNLLIQADPGSTTLYADGGAEQITLTGSTLSGTRFFTSSPDSTQVIESSTGTDPISYETANQQGTALEAINAKSLAIIRRYYDPWGDPVGAAPASWPDNHAYLGKPADPTTSLDLLGSRQYNPATGSFISLDPLFEPGDPLEMGGYSYAADNPVSASDSTGLLPVGPGGSGCSLGTEYLKQCGGNGNPGGSNGGGGNGGGGGNNLGDYNQGGGSSDAGSTSSAGAPGSTLLPPKARQAYATFFYGTFLKEGAYQPGSALWLLAALSGFCGGGRLLNAANICGQQLATTLTEDWEHASAPIAVAAGMMEAAGVNRLGDYLDDTDARAETNAGIDIDGLVCGGESFSAQTRVVLASGKNVRISTLSPGSKVIAWNTLTHRNEVETVTAVLVRYDTNLYDLKLKVGEQTAVIHTTSNHLFWDASAGRWVRASAVGAGTRLRSLHADTVSVVRGQAPHIAGWMWDLTVQGDHDFYVAVGNTGSLVHNASCVSDNGYKYPNNNGFEGPTVEMNLPTGYQFDRYGGDPASDTGRFASPAGTPFEMRGLPPSAMSRPLTTYEVVEPFDATIGLVKPWSGYIGGGFQLQFSSTISDLLRDGYIQVVP